MHSVVPLPLSQISSYTDRTVGLRLHAMRHLPITIGCNSTTLNLLLYFVCIASSLRHGHHKIDHLLTLLLYIVWAQYIAEPVGTFYSLEISNSGIEDSGIEDGEFE